MNKKQFDLLAKRFISNDKTKKVAELVIIYGLTCYAAEKKVFDKVNNGSCKVVSRLQYIFELSLKVAGAA